MEDSPFYSVSGLGQQRMIQQEHSAGDFLSRQGLKSADVLCVPQAFQTDGSAKNIRRRSKKRLCGVVPKNPLSHQETEDFSAVPLLFPRNGGAWGAITGAGRLPLRRRMALPGKSSGVMPCSARLPCILRQLSERAGSAGPSPSSLDRYSIPVRMYRDSYRFFGS